MKQDPTRTIVLRRRFSNDMARRFRELKAVIWKAVVKEDCLGLKEEKMNKLKLIANIKLSTPGFRAFEYRNDAEKVNEFIEWLKEQQEIGILEKVKNPLTGKIEPWTNTYIQTAYQKGILTGRAELKASGVEDLPPTVLKGSIGVGFNQPIHIERIEPIYSRIFSDLEGITEVMDRQISRVLSLGLAEGKGPYQIARNMLDTIDKDKTGMVTVGGKNMRAINRARLITRTEIVRTHNLGALTEYENFEPIVNEEILVQWWTALDERVRDTHIERHGRIYTRQEAEELIGEPNCRCALLPYMKSIHGSNTKAAAKREKALGVKAIKAVKVKQELLAKQQALAALEKQIAIKKKAIEKAKAKLDYAKKKKEPVKIKRYPIGKKYEAEEVGTLRGEYENVYKLYRKEYRKFIEGLEDKTEGSMQSVIRKKISEECPNVMNLLSIWQGSTQGSYPASLKFVAAKVENREIKAFVSSESIEKEVKKYLASGMEDRVIDEYIRVRAATQEYYRAVGQKKITLYRGTDGSKTGPAFKARCLEAQKEGYGLVPIRENALSGYTDEVSIADGFGKNAGGVTARIEMSTKDVVLPHELWWKNKFMSEREFIVLGGNKQVPINDLFWKGM